MYIHILHTCTYREVRQKSSYKHRLCNSLESPDKLFILFKERVKRVSLHNVFQVLFIVLWHNHHLWKVYLCVETARIKEVHRALARLPAWFHVPCTCCLDGRNCVETARNGKYILYMYTDAVCTRKGALIRGECTNSNSVLQNWMFAGQVIHTASVHNVHVHVHARESIHVCLS